MRMNSKLNNVKVWNNTSKFIYGDESNIFMDEWFSIENIESLESEFFILVRNFHDRLFMQEVVEQLFGKLFNIVVKEIGDPDKIENELLRIYYVGFKFRAFDWWERNEVNMVIMLILSLVSLFDRHLAVSHDAISKTRYRSFESLYSHINFLESYRESPVNIYRFFHRGIGKVLNTMIKIRQSGKDTIPLANDRISSLENIDNVSFILQSRSNLRSALSNVEDMNSEHIFNSLLQRYESIKRRF